MAERFACDPQEAELVARELTRVRSDMGMSQHPLGSATGTGSPQIDATLNEFRQAVAETRTGLLTSIERVAGLFAGLAEGTLDLDKAFADGVSER
ncbi:hypothetical protein AB0L74_32385 [Streptomyces sp. NPDC052020]|uniref:hypothetical protein n=1 Tax=Streptomyces sp. NPDC052020 TaxID=3155677 RepID=UPI00342EFA14